MRWVRETGKLGPCHPAIAGAPASKPRDPGTPAGIGANRLLHFAMAGRAANDILQLEAWPHFDAGISPLESAVCWKCSGTWKSRPRNPCAAGVLRSNTLALPIAFAGIADGP